MSDRLRQAPVDYVSLASYLAALGYPTRLELLDQLRFPHAGAEVKLTPHRVQPGDNPERPASRQAVQGHLDKLVEVDLVRSLPDPDGRAAPRFVVNPQKLYAVTEELRRLSTLYAGRGPTGDATGTMTREAPEEEAKGPRLVLVHGMYEGKSFALESSSASDGRWVVGRRRGLPVTLDYDPYVSLDHAAIRREGDRFVVQDLPDSKNGTSVNWRILPKGGARPLKGGDVVGVGRSLLCFAPE